MGSYLARQLIGDGEEVVLFQRRSQLPRSAADLEGKVQIFSGDIGNWVHVLDAVKKYSVDCIYHLAALRTMDCEASAANCFRVNVTGTFNVLEVARILGIRVIYVSSTAVYGMTPQTLESISRKVFNDTPQRPEHMYTTTKVCSERLCEQYYRQYGVNIRGVRPTVIVGPTRDISYYYGDWSGIIEVTAKGQPYIVHSDPNSPCAYIYVKDATRALIELNRAPESRLRQRIYNAHGFTATLSDVARVLKKYIPDAQINFEWDQSEYMKLHNSAVNYDVDNSIAYEDYGYQPKYHLDEMIKDFIDGVRAGEAG